jgi:hypothetical protein
VIGDNRPWFPTGNTGLISIVNSVIVAIVAGSLVTAVLGDQRFSVAAAITSLVAFLSSAVGHQMYQNRQFSQSEAHWISQFPCE